MSDTFVKFNTTILKRIHKKNSILWNTRYEITFTSSPANSGTWDTTHAYAEYGDILVISNEDSESTRSRIITCYMWSNPSEPRWSNKMTWPNNSAQYKYFDFKISGLTDTIIVEKNITIAASCTRELNKYTITWKYLEAYPDTWTTSTQTYTYGAKPSRTTALTVTSGTLRNYSIGWDSLAPVTGDRTITAQYQHQGFFGVTLENCTQTDGHPINEWYPHGTTCSISVKSNTNWAFDKTGTSTASSSFPVPKTLTVKAEYIYVTTNGNYCIPSIKTGWHAYNTPCTWEPANYYSFEEGTTQKSTTENLTIAGGTYTKEPQYVRVERIDNGSYASGATINGTAINNSTYYSKDSQVQWTATSSYSYGGESVSDLSSGTTIIPGGVMTAPNPDYVECVIKGTNCSPNKTSDILKVGTKITYTAYSGYSFAEGTTGTTTSTKTVALGTITYHGTADYKLITISGTNCTADVSTGYRKLGNIITWTGSTVDTNSKYSFSNTNKDGVVTDTIVTASDTYTRKASYLWYNVTAVNGTNCNAYRTSTFSNSFIPGWYVSGTKIHWKASGSAYAMTTSNATTLSENVKAGDNSRSAVVKQYTFTLTKNDNVSSIKVWRTSSPYQGATIGSENTPLINNNNTATVYYGDILNGKATSSTGYNFNGTNTTTSITYVSGSITADKSWSPTVSKNTYTVNLDLSTLPSAIVISEQWLSLEKTNSATQYPAGSTFSYNDTIYAIIKIQGSPTGINTTASGWTQINSSGQYNTYAIGSITATGTTSSLTIKPQIIVNNYPVTISSGYGYNNVYLSTDPNAVSGSSSGTAFPYNSTVYGFAILNVHASTCSGTLISGTANTPGAIYRISSKTVSASTTSFGEITLDSNSISVCFTGDGSDTGTVEFYISSPISASGNGYMSKSESGNSITISCTTDNLYGSEDTNGIVKITYDSQYNASCILKNYAGTEIAWNSSYSFSSEGILLEVELSPGGSISS